MKTQTKSIGIKEKDIVNQLRNHKGNQIFLEALSKSTSKTIIPLLIRYISFNRLFGAGVSGLSSKLAARSEMFIDSQEPAVSRDRSMDVASKVFAAGIDEFGDTTFKTNRPTHRILAQATMKGILSYARYSKEDIDDLARSLDTARIDDKVMNGYGVSTDSEEGIFKAMGFHIASEFLADKEFNIMNKELKEKYPDLVKYLESKKVKVSNRKIPAYHWIKIHTSVEKDHFKHALMAANTSLRYYVGSQNKATVKKQILLGISNFAYMQEEFMRSLN